MTICLLLYIIRIIDFIQEVVHESAQVLRETVSNDNILFKTTTTHIHCVKLCILYTHDIRSIRFPRTLACSIVYNTMHDSPKFSFGSFSNGPSSHPTMPPRIESFSACGSQVLMIFLDVLSPDRSQLISTQRLLSLSSSLDHLSPGSNLLLNSHSHNVTHFIIN